MELMKDVIAKRRDSSDPWDDGNGVWRQENPHPALPDGDFSLFEDSYPMNEWHPRESLPEMSNRETVSYRDENNYNVYWRYSETENESRALEYWMRQVGLTPVGPVNLPRERETSARFARVNGWRFYHVLG